MIISIIIIVNIIIMIILIIICYNESVHDDSLSSFLTSSKAPTVCQIEIFRNSGQFLIPFGNDAIWYPRPFPETSGNLESRSGFSLSPSRIVT